ncbi:MAG TPA: MBL fold metallo-hydrolase [Frankiaceae bacterium]|nr:MBL fold metallo-hydrolase [Frankiaceae bacterium]
MAYTGNVIVGGPADERDLPGLSIRKVSVGPMDNNCYLLRCAETGEQLLIDAANDAETLLGLVGDAGLSTVVTTHQHWDHIQALEAVVGPTDAQTVASAEDAPAIPVRTSLLVGDGDEIAVGRVPLQIIHLVGHTPGSIAVLYQPTEGAPHLFTGDSLFPGGPGRTTSPEDFTSLMDDLERKVFGQLPDETWVYPGHGKDTTLGAERPHLGEWRARGW